MADIAPGIEELRRVDSPTQIICCLNAGSDVRRPPSATDVPVAHQAEQADQSQLGRPRPNYGQSMIESELQDAHG